ncbi:afadin isoform X17 [Phlebotomus papatasi]|uniref:afadin isoform X17 n=1 Tax=Phlebotomus papatasi TaxID=29031 RepID=UPI002484702D|nr:afadin isoform X17 [Phlebotomus papatasi]
MKMSANEKRLMDREALHSVIRQWNANRLDLFELSPPDDNLQFHGVMRFYFQDAGQKVATKCIRVASDATVQDVIATLIEKFRPDMRMLSLPNYALYEVHSNHEERKLNGDEKPLLVQLNWNFDDREGRFLLRDTDQKTNTLESGDTNFKRKLSKREQKEQKKKKEKLQKMQSTNTANAENHVAEKLYTELPETSFTRSISNPEAVMRRRRQQKLEKKLQQFRSKDGGPDTGGTLKIYGESLCRDVPYKTLLLSIRDCAQAVVREMLAKYGLDKADPLHYCLVQVNSDGTEYILDDDECPLSILMNHPTSRGSIMFHVRRRPADSQPRRRKKKPLGVSNGSNNMSAEREGPMLVEVTHSGDGGRRIKLGSEPVEVGSANTNTLQLFGPPIQPRHCLISLHEGVCTVTPLHPDALTFVNGHHIQQPTILHNGSVVMFGRVSSYRFVDSPSDGRYNLALSQSQLDSACLYDSRSPTSPSWHEDERPLSPVQSIAQGQTLNKLSSYLDEPPSANQSIADSSQQHLHHHLNSNSTGQSGVGGQTPTVTSNVSTDNLTEQYMDDNKNLASAEPDTKQAQSQGQSRSKEQYETNFDVDGTIETETKSISSNKSAGSNQEIRSKIQSVNESGQEPILPAVLEFPETHQEAFLHQVIPDLDVNAPYFKLAPVYTLYLCARYRASTHYRPDLQPTERAHKLTAFLHHVANMIYTCVQEQYTDPKVVSFWMANSSEFLHFLKSDRHISAFSLQAQEVLAETVQSAFRHLVNSFQAELSQTLNQFLSENIDHDSAAGLVLTVLGADMALLRRCRVNAALTIQLFSQLFHYINVVCFNKIVTTPQMCNATWGKVVSDRLQLLELWAERLGLELAADCHLAKINQCAQFLQAPKTTVAEVQQLAHSCFRLNSLQMAALLSQEPIPRNLVDTALRMAESVADELTLADGREVRLEESTETQLALLLPEDGFSCDVVRGIPAGLVDFLTPLQNAGMCRLAAQPTSIGLWTVYMHQYNQRSPSAMSTKMPQPDIQVIKLHKNNGGMGLSIVAAKGAGQERLGIYIKSVVPGGAADADGRLQAGDQLLRVDGQSLIGITQERAADYLVRTGPVVTLEVAKQGAIYHGLATLLQQPSPVIQREVEMSQHRLRQQQLHQQQLHFFATNRSYYDSGSEESLNRYLFNTECMPMSQERCGSPSYSLRLGDHYDMYGRRRSSSSSHEDILLNPNFQQKVHIDPRYRDTRPIASNSSLNRDYEAPPMIYVEEYSDDVIRKDSDSMSGNSDNRSAESIQNQPLNEDSLASCVDSDDIPFIDDDNSPPSVHTYLPPSMSCSQQDVRQIGGGGPSKSPGIIVKNRRDSGSSCRKTVSFDIINNDEEMMPLLAGASNNAATTEGNNVVVNVRKSNTCDSLNKDEPLTVAEKVKKKCSGTKESILKFCKLKKGQQNCDQHGSTASTSTGDNAHGHVALRDDNFSIYFDKDGDQPPAAPTPSKRSSTSAVGIDLSEMTLDLSGIHSDSTTSSGGQENNGRETNSMGLTDSKYLRRIPLLNMCDYDRVIERKNAGHRVVWSTTPPYHDDVILGNGKVRALTKYFDFLHDGTTESNKYSKRSLSYPNLQHIVQPKGQNDHKLSEIERANVMVQLREWSKFGSRTPSDLPKNSCTVHCRADKCTASVINLTAEEYGKCPHMDEIFNRIDNVPPPNRFKSVPDITTYHFAPFRTHKKFPDAYIVKKKRPSRCCSVGDDLDKKAIHIQSCPDIPRNSATFLTLRQIKSRQAMNKAQRQHAHMNVDGRNSRFQSR